mmetsp:Transcript_30799/g.77926  ORF Transcript_30799/g.77926 Transcript_30799/m.77926 type:complete len:1105 (-) Transcript_30799:155-3469(-)
MSLRTSRRMGNKKNAKRKRRQNAAENPPPARRGGAGGAGRKASETPSGGRDHGPGCNVRDGENPCDPLLDPSAKRRKSAAPAPTGGRAGDRAAGSDAGLEASGRRSGVRDHESDQYEALFQLEAPLRGSGDRDHRDESHGQDEENPYEALRRKNIARNRQTFVELGLHQERNGEQDNSAPGRGEGSRIGSRGTALKVPATDRGVTGGTAGTGRRASSVPATDCRVTRSMAPKEERGQAGSAARHGQVESDESGPGSSSSASTGKAAVNPARGASVGGGAAVATARGAVGASATGRSGQAALAARASARGGLERLEVDTAKIAELKALEDKCGDPFDWRDVDEKVRSFVCKLEGGDKDTLLEGMGIDLDSVTMMDILVEKAFAGSEGFFVPSSVRGSEKAVLRGLPKWVCETVKEDTLLRERLLAYEKDESVAESWDQNWNWCRDGTRVDKWDDTMATERKVLVFLRAVPFTVIEVEAKKVLDLQAKLFGGPPVKRALLTGHMYWEDDDHPASPVFNKIPKGGAYVAVVLLAKNNVMVSNSEMRGALLEVGVRKVKALAMHGCKIGGIAGRQELSFASLVQDGIILWEIWRQDRHDSERYTEAKMKLKERCKEAQPWYAINQLSGAGDSAAGWIDVALTLQNGTPGVTLLADYSQVQGWASKRFSFYRPFPGLGEGPLDIGGAGVDYGFGTFKLENMDQILLPEQLFGGEGSERVMVKNVGKVVYYSTDLALPEVKASSGTLCSPPEKVKALREQVQRLSDVPNKLLDMFLGRGDGVQGRVNHLKGLRGEEIHGDPSQSSSRLEISIKIQDSGQDTLFGAIMTYVCEGFPLAKSVLHSSPSVFVPGSDLALFAARSYNELFAGTKLGRDSDALDSFARQVWGTALANVAGCCSGKITSLSRGPCGYFLPKGLGDGWRGGSSLGSGGGQVQGEAGQRPARQRRPTVQQLCKSSAKVVKDVIWVRRERVHTSRDTVKYKKFKADSNELRPIEVIRPVYIEAAHVVKMPEEPGEGYVQIPRNGRGNEETSKGTMRRRIFEFYRDLGRGAWDCHVQSDRSIWASGDGDGDVQMEEMLQGRVFKGPSGGFRNFRDLVVALMGRKGSAFRG